MTVLRYDGRVAIVTGAGGGLGKHHALLLASRGARVVVNDVGASVVGEGSDDGPARSVVEEILDGGGEAVADTHTVATPEGGQAIVRAAIEAFGRIDIVVNNAGIVRDKPFREITQDQLAPLIDVHLNGAFYVTRPAWLAMREQGYGRVINTTSAAGLLGSAGMSSYGAAKTGLIGFTRVLAAEGAKHNIKVNGIAPIAATRMLTHAMAEAEQVRGGQLEPADHDMMNAITSLLDPALVSPVVAFLAHEDCPVSGEIYTAGAGQVARFFIGRTRGHYARTVEDVRDHLAEIRDDTGYTIPADPGEEMAQLLQAVAER